MGVRMAAIYRSIRNKENSEWKHPFCHAGEEQGGAGVWVNVNK